MWTHDAEVKLKTGFDSTIEEAFCDGENGELENLAQLFSPTAIETLYLAALTGLAMQQSI